MTELAGAVAVAAVCLALLYNYLGVYLTFFGEPPTETPASIAAYWVLVVVGVVAWVTMAAAGKDHRRGWVAALVAGVLLGGCCVVFAIGGASPRQQVEVGPQPGPVVECRSGGDSLDCPGG